MSDTSRAERALERLSARDPLAARRILRAWEAGRLSALQALVKAQTALRARTERR